MQKTRLKTRLIMLAILGVCASYPLSADAQQPVADAPIEVQLSPFEQQLKDLLANVQNSTSGKAAKARLKGITAYYQAAGFKPVWIINNQPTQKAHSAVKVMQRAAEHGLQPSDYKSDALFQEINALGTVDADLNRLANLEWQLSRSVIAYAQHLNAGRLNPQSVNREIVVFPKAVSAEKILPKLRDTKSIEIYLRLMAPYTPRYDRLRIALANYKVMAASGKWTQIAKGEVLKPGMQDPRILSIRKRMEEDNKLARNIAPTELYDEPLVEAVKKFQAGLGLEPDGVIGPQTLAQMNITITERIRTMELNLERRRWMQNDFGRYYVFANLADQVIKLVRDEKTLHAELIQVGQPYHRTPVFSDTMEYLELNPFWNVPYSISTKEYLPKLKRNAGALQRQNIQVIKGGKIVNPFSIPWNSYSRKHFPVRLRQDSGKKNALGRIKFMFPNKFNVYIHDTPAKSKFSKASRYFSHGCLRLNDPLTMAEKILNPLGWSRKKIDGVISSGKRTIVKLKEKIPVHVTYLTAWVNKDGSVHFRRDIYGRDKILDKAMNKASAG